MSGWLVRGWWPGLGGGVLGCAGSGCGAGAGWWRWGCLLAAPGRAGGSDAHHPAQETDSFVFAAGLRRTAADNPDENSGPMLEFETWSGETPDARGASQGKIQFDLVGVERAAFPVLDACGT